MINRKMKITPKIVRCYFEKIPNSSHLFLNKNTVRKSKKFLRYLVKSKEEPSEQQRFEKLSNLVVDI